jgi:hypothetical protein
MGKKLLAPSLNVDIYYSVPPKKNIDRYYSVKKKINSSYKQRVGYMGHILGWR